MCKDLDKRNELAHFSVIVMGTTKNEELWRLVPYFSMGQVYAASLKQKSINGLTVDDIKIRAIRFQQTTRDLKCFCAEMLRLKGQIAVNYEPEPDLLRQLRNPTDQTT